MLPHSSSFCITCAARALGAGGRGIFWGRAGGSTTATTAGKPPKNAKGGRYDGDDATSLENYSTGSTCLISLSLPITRKNNTQ